MYYTPQVCLDKNISPDLGLSMSYTDMLYTSVSSSTKMSLHFNRMELTLVVEVVEPLQDFFSSSEKKKGIDWCLNMAEDVN